MIPASDFAAQLDPKMREDLGRYLALMDDRRLAAATRRWEALSKREQRLVREAAVMGYVLGVRSQPDSHKATIPPDPVIVTQVIEHAGGMRDLYPTIYRSGSRRKKAA